MDEQLKLIAENNENNSETAKLLTIKVQNLLIHRYEFPQWALFFEVIGETGHQADAIAINMFHSRGHRILGFEIKASRGDWLNELKNAHKADYFFNHCDEWYIVEGKEGIVKEKELPPGWGLISARNNRLYTRVKSDIGIKNPNREFFVRMIQKAYSKQNPLGLIHDAEQRGRELGRKDYLEDEYWIKGLKEKAELIDKLNEAGLPLWRYSKERIEEIKSAISLIDNIYSGWSIRSYLESIERTCQDIIEKKNECIGTIEKIKCQSENKLGSLKQFDGGEHG